jgi:hypothetical protein
VLNIKTIKEMQTINLKVDYRLQQRINTEKEIERMQLFCERISIDEMHSLLAEIGLKLDMNENSHALYYYNTSNAEHYYQMTTCPLDKKKVSVYNVNSDFYHKYLKGWETKHAITLKRLRMDYFCTVKKRGIEYIVSF